VAPAFGTPPLVPFLPLPRSPPLPCLVASPSRTTSPSRGLRLSPSRCTRISWLDQLGFACRLIRGAPAAERNRHLIWRGEMVPVPIRAQCSLISPASLRRSMPVLSHSGIELHLVIWPSLIVDTGVIHARELIIRGQFEFYTYSTGRPWAGCVMHWCVTAKGNIQHGSSSEALCPSPTLCFVCPIRWISKEESPRRKFWFSFSLECRLVESAGALYWFEKLGSSQLQFLNLGCVCFKLVR